MSAPHTPGPNSEAPRKPTLQEIAAMPFSQTVDALRKHYDPAWGKVDEDGEPAKAWRVRFDWEIKGRFDEVIEAASEEEALEIAKEQAADDAFGEEVEADFVRITPAKAKGGQA